jgi:RNA polymerase sigma-70 factor, ECF subfamily
MLTPDQRLLECIAQGDCQAFAEFYDQHAPRVFGLLVRLLGNRDDAEDTLQDTFWQIWRSADRYDCERAKPEVWLLTIARSRAMDCQRRRPRTTNLAIEDTLMIANDPCEVLAQHESRQRLQSALACLPDEQRTAVVLSFFNGCTHVQIADQLGIPLGTAKTRISLGMKRLRILLSLGLKERAR